MILQALYQHYHDLLELGEISPPGWGESKVSYAIDLDDEGNIVQVLSLKVANETDRKPVPRPQILRVPMPVKRTSKPIANFLCDGAAYILGVDIEENSSKTAERFRLCKELHLSLLLDVDSPSAKAVVAFFEQWNPASDHPQVADHLEELMDGSNIVLYYMGRPVHSDAAVKAAWQSHYDGGGEGAVLPCLITGKDAPVALTHPSIKGVRDAQSSGAALVSFNAPSFCSYEREQNANAPMSDYAAFAYTTALNHLLSDRERVSVIGDTTIVCWAAGGDKAYQDMGMMSMMADTNDKLSDQDLMAIMKSLANGIPIVWDETTLDPENRFYVLGLAPNAARLSVRFFLQNNFGDFIKNALKHQERLEIDRPSFDKNETISLWKLLNETVNQKSKDKSAKPQLAGDMLRAILTDGYYPATLLNGCMLRIRAEQNISRGKAAIIKAYYLQNENQGCPKEVLTVSLNRESTHTPYVLGRLFSVLENIQLSAIQGINTTIKDRYFNSAAATPAVIFPLLVNLAQKHLRKLETGRRIYFEKQMGELMQLLTEEYPTRLSLPEQGAFQLGYYHQTQMRYKKKEDVINE